MNSIKQADVVISTVGHSLLGQQDKILSAIKEAGNVKVNTQIKQTNIYVVHAD